VRFGKSRFAKNMPVTRVAFVLALAAWTNLSNATKKATSTRFAFLIVGGSLPVVLWASSEWFGA